MTTWRTWTHGQRTASDIQHSSATPTFPKKDKVLLRTGAAIGYWSAKKIGIWKHKMAKPVKYHRWRKSDSSERNNTSCRAPTTSRALLIQSSSKERKGIDFKNTQFLPMSQDQSCQMQLSGPSDAQSRLAPTTRVEQAKEVTTPASAEDTSRITADGQTPPPGNSLVLADMPVSQQNSLRSLVGTAEDLGQLRSLRLKARRSRSRLEKKRKQLNEKRLATEQADEAFMKYTRKTRPLGPVIGNEQIHEELEAHYKALQNTRDEYGPMEEEYTELEDALDEAEYEMVKIENHLYSIMVDVAGDASERSPDFPRDAQIENYTSGPRPFLGLFAGVQPTFHPLIVKYQTRLGDLDLAKERHDYLVQDREALLAERESRSLVGFELNADSEAALDSLPSQEAAILAEIRGIELDVEKLKDECLREGLDVEESDDESGCSHSV